MQKALTEARDARLVAFLPNGTYLVNNSLECFQDFIEIDDVDRRMGQFQLCNPDFPCVLMGTTLSGNRAVIKLGQGLSNGTLNLVDTSIEYTGLPPSNGVAISSADRAIYLNGVFTR